MLNTIEAARNENSIFMSPTHLFNLQEFILLCLTSSSHSTTHNKVKKKKIIIKLKNFAFSQTSQLT